jgi:hypothetical protein
MRWVRSSGVALAGAGLAVVLLGAEQASASGVDGAGNVLVVPLVFAGSERTSVVTLRNAGPEVIEVRATYVGAGGTVKAANGVGPIECERQTLRGDQSLSLSLADWCGMRDGQNFGYLKLESSGDSRINFTATSTTRTRQGAAFVVPGQPVGAFDPGRGPLPFFGRPSSLHAIGLQGEIPPQGSQPPLKELACYVASLDEPKHVEVSLLDSAGRVIAAGFRLKLDAQRMERVLPLPALGLPPGTRLRELRVLVTPVSFFDSAMMIAGCALESRLDGTVAYQPARTPEPLDEARLTTAGAETLITPAGLKIAAIWTHTSTGDSVDRKVTLATYLRPEDRVRCTLGMPSGSSGFDPQPWLELQVRDPRGTVVAGGDRAADTGVFSTGPRGRYRDQRWHVDVSLNEVAQAQSPWPRSEPHWWAVICQSSAGMSALLPVDDPTATDDF